MGKQRHKHGQPNCDGHSDYLSKAELAAGVENGTIFIGSLKIFPQKRKLAYIAIPGHSIDVLIPDERSRNRAFHGDQVYVELLPQHQWNAAWKRKETSVSIRPHDEPLSSTCEEPVGLWNVKVDALASRSGSCAVAPEIETEMCALDIAAQRVGKQPTGRVVGILKASHKTSLVGFLKAPESSQIVFFQPADKRFSDMIIPLTELPDAYVRDPVEMQKRIYVADIAPDWHKLSKCPFGCSVRDLGAIGSIHSETEAILKEAGLDHPLYVNSEILQGVISEDVSDINSWSIPPEEIALRRDLRAQRIFTIDPSNARDLDDALHITELPDGTFEVGAHIADVSFFVKEGIPLDREAYRRATSVYLVHKVIPMLPPILCEQLCSLNPNVDRLAFSCIWKMNGDGTLCDSPAWFGKTVIRSCAKLDYATAQRMVDGLVSSDSLNTDAIPEDLWEFSRRPESASVCEEFPVHKNWEVVQDVKLLHRVAMARRALRLQIGALTLNRPKVTFVLNEAGNPVSLETYIVRDTNKMVEEYMLLANYLVAEHLVLKCGDAAFLRRHPAPDPSNDQPLQEVAEITKRLNVSVNVSSGKMIQQTLDAVLAASDTNHLLAVEALITHVMKLAEYFVVDGKDSLKWRHFALGIPYYTHFTSPIRRYADIIVHRLLFSAISNVEPVVVDKKEITRLGDMSGWCNSRKCGAKEAEEKCDKMFMSVYLMNNSCVEEALVIGMGRKSFTLLVPKFGIETRIFTSVIPNVNSWYDEDRNMIILTAKPLDETNIYPVDKSPCFDVLELSLMSKVRVYLSSISKPSLDVVVNLLGPAA